MPKGTKLFVDPKFNEWVYTVLDGLTYDQVASLNSTEIRLISTSKQRKKFITENNLERILSIFTKLRIHWFLGFFPDLTAIKNDIVAKTYQTFLNKKAGAKVVEHTEEMLAKKMFIIDSRQFALGLSMMSTNCHSEVYLINPHFRRFKQTLKTIQRIRLRNDFFSAGHITVQEDVSREIKNFCEIAIEYNKLHEGLLTYLNLSGTDVAVLMVLYMNPQNYVAYDYIKRQTGYMNHTKKLGMSLKYLFMERRMVEKRAITKSNAYMITQEGIITVGKINNHIVNSVYNKDK